MLRTTVACFARRRRRRRRGHRAALRRRARPARRLRPPDRPQHPDPAGRGGAPGPGDRPGRRLLVRRAAHRATSRRRPGTGSTEIERAGGHGRGAGSGPGRRAARAPPGSGAARQPGRTAATRSPASASSRTWPRSCRARSPRAGAAPAAGCRGSAARRPSRRCATGPTPRPPPARGRRLPGHARPGGRAHRAVASPPTCSRPAASRPARRPRDPDGRRGVRAAARPSPACAPATSIYAEQAETGRRGAAGGRRAPGSGSPGRPAATYAGVDGYVFAGLRRGRRPDRRPRPTWEWRER